MFARNHITPDSALGGWQMKRSLRWEGTTGGTYSYLYRTGSSPTGGGKYSYSSWIKRVSRDEQTCLWGAGGGANKPPCCCGHTFFGNTGAYMSVIIPVTEGHTYTLCAGCAYCCYAYTTSGSQRMSGCPSYVQGCHFCNFCADGGRGGYATWNGDMGSYCACRFSGYGQPGYGFYLCNTGGDLCHTGQNMCCHVKHLPGAGYHGAITDIDNPTEENVVYGIRGLWPCVCNDSNNYGWECHAPIYCFHTSTRCNPSWSSGTCCGCVCSAWASSYLRYPGAGGFYSHAMGGSNGLYGDSGKFGMVRVSYC